MPQCSCIGGQEQEGIYYQGITGMKADMSGARTTPKLLELQEECLAKDFSASSSDESSDDEYDPEALAKLACLEAPAIPAALQSDCSVQNAEGLPFNKDEGEAQFDTNAESEVSSSDDDSDQSGDDVVHSILDLKADRKAHKKAVKEANRERRKHKMPKHVKKKKIKSHKK